MSIGTYQVKNANDRDYTTGIAAGLGAHIPIQNNSIFSFQPEIMYIQKGYQYSKTQASGPFPIDLTQHTNSRSKLNYIEIPLLAKATVGKGAVKYYLTAGPSTGFAINGTYSTLYKDNYQSSFEQKGRVLFKKRPNGYSGQDAYYYPKGYSRVDLGLQVGTGISLQIGLQLRFMQMAIGQKFHSRLVLIP